MGYILYGDIGSGSGPVEMALAEIGAEVELRDVPLATDAQLATDYRKLNPMGRIPTLILPDGTVMTESAAMLIALADRHPEATLLPAGDDPARAVALRWILLVACEFYPHVTRYDYPERFSLDPAHAPAIAARAKEMAREPWRLIERECAPSPFVLGARFSVADIYMAALSRWNEGAQWMPAECPRVEGLAQAVARRPRIAPVWARHVQGQPQVRSE